MSEPEIDPVIVRYANVLGFMWWAMNEPQGKTKPLGELMRLGCQAHGLPAPPTAVEEALLTAAFKLAANGTPFSTVMA
jgi:hypothetical protein